MIQETPCPDVVCQDKNGQRKHKYGITFYLIRLPAAVCVRVEQNSIHFQGGKYYYPTSILYA